MSNNLDLSQITSGQSNKHTTANEQSAELDAALTEKLSVDLSSSSATLTDEQFRRNIMFTGTGHTVARALTVPAIERGFFVVKNAGTSSGALTVTRGATTVVMAIGTYAVFATDGTTDGLEQLAIGGSVGAFTDLSDVPSSYSSQGLKLVRVNTGETALEFFDETTAIAGFYGGTPSTSEVILAWVANETVVFPSGLSTSSAYAGTGPSAATDFDIQKNGVSVGTMSFAMSANTATFTFSSAQTFSAGDRFELIAPAGTLNSIADLIYSFGGTK